MAIHDRFGPVTRCNLHNLEYLNTRKNLLRAFDHGAHKGEFHASEIDFNIREEKAA